MSISIARRDFLVGVAAAGTVLATSGRLAAAPWKTKLHKARIGNPSEAVLDEWKEAGFEGYEQTNHGASPADAEAIRKTSEKHGMRIHSVMFGWANFNSPDAARSRRTSPRDESPARGPGLRRRHRALVPCRMGGMADPDALGLRDPFDEPTGHVSQVVGRRQRRYAAVHRGPQPGHRHLAGAVAKLIPVAEKTGVIIALENVWNNLWVKPDVPATSWPRSGTAGSRRTSTSATTCRYAPPQEWIRTLGKLIVKAATSRISSSTAARPRRRRGVHPPRRQHQLAGGPQGARRGRLQRLDDDRGRRPAARRVPPAAGLDHRRQIGVPAIWLWCGRPACSLLRQRLACPAESGPLPAAYNSGISPPTECRRDACTTRYKTGGASCARVSIWNCALAAGYARISVPEVFELGDDDKARVKVDPVPAGAEASCREAAEQCPSSAIQVE